MLGVGGQEAKNQAGQHCSYSYTILTSLLALQPIMLYILRLRIYKPTAKHCL